MFCLIPIKETNRVCILLFAGIQNAIIRAEGGLKNGEKYFCCSLHREVESEIVLCREG